MLSMVMMVLPLALKLIDMFIAGSANNSAAKTAAISLAKELYNLGATGLKSRFDQEKKEVQSGDDQWRQVEAQNGPNTTKA